MKADFDAIDANGDGNLTWMETVDAILKMTRFPEPSRTAITRSRLKHLLFDLMDADQNGVVSFKEYVQQYGMCI